MANERLADMQESVAISGTIEQAFPITPYQKKSSNSS